MSDFLENEIDAAMVAAEAVMLRSESDRTILIVEGPTDQSVYVNFIDQMACEIVIAHGRDNAIEALAILNSRQFCRVLCIVDLDYSHLLNRPVAGNGVFLTDDHDLETMIIRSSAFDRVLREYGSRIKITEHSKSICEAAHPIGILRFYSLNTGKKLVFENIKYTFVDRRTLAINVEHMIRTIYNNSRISLKSQEFRDVACYVARKSKGSHNVWHMCCGHDLTAMLGKSLQSLFGTRRAIEIDAASVERVLRLAYSFDDFRKTQLHEQIRLWEENNAPHHCLKMV